MQKVERHETLAQILQHYKIDPLTIDQIARKAAESEFNPRKIKQGQRYRVFCQDDSCQQMAYFIYHASPVQYYIIDLTDSVKIRSGRKKVETRVMKKAGIIRSSLYETLLQQDASPLLANKLSEIYAWEIDFFRIKKGDRFKAIYERKFVDGEPIGFGNILGTFFVHQGDTTYGIPFEQDEKRDFFDREGNSLRKELLKAPLRYTRITSGYTTRRYHPIQKRYKAHRGVDYAAPRGTPVRSVGEGVVVAARYAKYNGNFVKIRHNSIHTTQYLHLYKIASGISRGTKVKQGQTIGYVGSTGLATGPHLCYRFWKNGYQVNPLTVEVPPSEPVNADKKTEFEKKKQRIVKRLNKITFPSPPPEV
jgi:murein DD-endopeptidase MepM/ murein hydrolase activator NlpD